jgi:hypothetical protein
MRLVPRFAWRRKDINDLCFLRQEALVLDVPGHRSIALESLIPVDPGAQVSPLSIQTISS